MGEQPAEAAGGATVRVVLAEGLGLGGLGAAGGRDRAGRGGRVLVGLGQRRPGLAQVRELIDDRLLDALLEQSKDEARGCG
ncbi:MAG: hypothetical protein ACRDOK_10030 [Streptosporangiaceae bacterium]